MWTYPDFLQLHHFLAEDCLCEEPRTSYHNMCGEPQSLHEIGANQLKTFQRKYVRRHSQHHWGSLPGSRNAPRAVPCLTLRVTINLMFLKPAYSSGRPWSSASASLLLPNHESKLDLSSHLLLNQTTSVLNRLRPSSWHCWGEYSEREERLNTMCLRLQQKPMPPNKLLWQFSWQHSTEFILHRFRPMSSPSSHSE